MKAVSTRRSPRKRSSASLAEEVEKALAPGGGKPLTIDTAHKPFVILMVGVNGAGKTTTIGKLASENSPQTANP